MVDGWYTDVQHREGSGRVVRVVNCSDIPGNEFGTPQSEPVGPVTTVTCHGPDEPRERRNTSLSASDHRRGPESPPSNRKLSGVSTSNHLFPSLLGLL